MGRNRVYLSYLSAYKELPTEKKEFFEKAAKVEKERYDAEL